MAGEPWTENDVAILAREYFAVLRAEQAGEVVNKTDVLRKVQRLLPTERSVHTLKDRCARISEELARHDLPWVDGWRPPPLTGQVGNTANVSAITWRAIEPFTRGLDPTGPVVSAIPAAPAEPAADDASVGDGQGRMSDTELRRAIEDLAQERLMARYRALGWTVEDTRIGHPYDARATRGSDVQYLEAKGTTSAGSAVVVTHGEVAWARAHPDQCVIGIVSEVRITPQGTVDEGSGILRVYDWNPDAGVLTPVEYRWAPPT